jgi:drug/metabolite transporter (DMT)-like permease
VKNLINVGALVVFTLVLSGGQLLFKKLGLAIRGQPLADGLWLIIRLPILYIALTLYGLATVLWIWILSRVPLAKAYPWIAVGVVIVPLIGWSYFGERLGPLFWLGVVLIFAGMLLVQQASGVAT